MHNIIIGPGFITESDHIPIIIKLTTKAVTRTKHPTPDLSRANWNRFSEQITNEMENIETTKHINKDSSDTKLSQWYAVIETGIANNTPLIKKQNILKPGTSLLLNHIQNEYKQLRVTSERE